MAAKRTVKIFSILIIGCVLAFAYYFFKNNRSAKEDLVIHGNVDIRQIDLGFRVNGRLQNMNFEEGDVVSEGNLLAQIDPKPFELELNNQESQLQAAKANYDKLLAGNRYQEIEAAKAFLKEKEVAHANALITLNRQKDLAAKKFASQQTLDDALAREKEAKAQFNSAKSNLNLLESGFRSEEIKQAKAQLDAAIARTDIAKTNLADTKLLAPSKGIIFTRIREPGSIIAFGEPVYTLSITEPIWVRGYISEVDLGRVKPGMQVFVFIDTYQNPFQGQIGFISPQAEFTPKNIETKEIRTDLVYRLRIAVADPQGHLRQGMPVTIHIPINPERQRTMTPPQKLQHKLPAREAS